MLVSRDPAQAAALDQARRAIPPAAREGTWTAPDGHGIGRIDFAVPSPARGSILFLPGRGDAYEKGLETLAGWHADGWAVTAIEWRGQGRSGRLGLDAATGHIDDFATWIADLAAFWAEWKTQTPGPHVLAGHSMGGHLALRALVDRACDPDAAFLVAPMLGIHGMGLPTVLLHAIARGLARIGDPRRPAWKASEAPGADPGLRSRFLTHDAARYADDVFWRAERPHLAMGPASWGWVAAALASIRHVLAPGALERVRVPVLLLATRADRLVRYAPIAAAARRLPDATFLAFGAEARHEILRETDPVRDRALAAIDAFLDRVSPAP